MKTYIVERDIANIGKTSSEDLIGLSRKLCSVIAEMDLDKIKWSHSYVSEDKIYDIYAADNISTLIEHSEKGLLPITSIMEITSVINPNTAEAY